MAKDRRGNFSMMMTVGNNTTLYGYSELDAFGALQKIAKQNTPIPYNLQVDAVGNAMITYLSSKKLNGRDEVILTFEGFDVNVDGATPTTSYGKPVRLRWEPANERYSTFPDEVDARPELRTFLEALDGEDVAISVTGYTKP